MEAMIKFPIVFRFRDFIAGNGFVAHVQVDGRALLVSEGVDDYWVYGVQPGSLAGGASDKASALIEFQNRYQSVLFDMAADAKSYDEFKLSVEAFFNAIDQVDLADWEKALESVRRENASLDELPTWKAETIPSRVLVADLSEPKKAKPALNELSEVARAA